MARVRPHWPATPAARLSAAGDPAAPAHPPAPRAPLAGELPAPEGRAGTARRVPRVWVVEDDTTVTLYLKELLSDHGMDVTTFPDAVKALHAYMGDPHAMDVVVTDQRMALLSGEAMARAMLKLRPRLRVILCTGYADELDARRLDAIGVAGLLRKPFDALALVRAVRGDPPRPA